MDSAREVRVRYGELDQATDVLEALSQLPPTPETEGLLEEAQSLAAYFRERIAECRRCSHFKWHSIPAVLCERYWPGKERFCVQCGDLR